MKDDGRCLQHGHIRDTVRVRCGDPSDELVELVAGERPPDERVLHPVLD